MTKADLEAMIADLTGDLHERAQENARLQAENVELRKAAGLLLKRNVPAAGRLDADCMTSSEARGRRSNCSHAGQHTVWLTVEEYHAVLDLLGTPKHPEIKRRNEPGDLMYEEPYR